MTSPKASAAPATKAAAVARKQRSANPGAPRSPDSNVQAKRLQAAKMVRDLQDRAEALLANADRLLDRLS